MATWNVDSVRARFDRLAAWLERWQPDVCALQEIKCADHQFPSGAFAELGYDSVSFGTGGYGGVALLAPSGIDDVSLGVPGAPAPFDEPRLLRATVGGVRVVNVYAPNGRKVGAPQHHVKLAWYTLLTEVLSLELLDTEHLVLLGDLNIAPADVDIWAPERYRRRNLTSPPERAAFARLLELGLIDVVRAAHGDSPAFTWWNRRNGFFEENKGWRLDHVLATPSVAHEIAAVTIDRDERGQPGTSDHAPIVVDLD